MNKYLVVLTESVEGGWYTITRPTYLVDEYEEALRVADLMNQVNNYTDRDEDGEWWGKHYAVTTIPVWGEPDASA